MKQMTSSAPIRIDKRLLQVVRGHAAKRTRERIFIRNADDLEALERVIELLNATACASRGTTGSKTDIALPSDPRELHQLYLCAHLAAFGKLQPKAQSLGRRIAAFLPMPPLAQTLYDEYKSIDGRRARVDAKFLRLRLFNLGYPLYLGYPRVADPEGCIIGFDRTIGAAREEGWLTGHMQVQLAAERGQGLLADWQRCSIA